jgi:hypothetical protein
MGKEGKPDYTHTRRAVLWGLTLTVYVLVLTYWAFFGTVSLTRCIPGWTVWDSGDNHTYFLAYAITGGALTGLMIFFGVTHIVVASRRNVEYIGSPTITSALLATVMFQVVQLTTYLVGLSFAWGYDSRFGSSQPWSTSEATTLEWVLFNFGVFVASLLGFFNSVQISLQHGNLYPTV